SAQHSDYWAVLPGYEKFFNQYFQTYGRHVKFINQDGPNQNSTSDPSLQQADAQYAAEENHAFAVAAPQGSIPFHLELARRRVPAVSDFIQMDNATLGKIAPYYFEVLPNADLVAAQVAEYWCKRLKGQVAAH